MGVVWVLTIAKLSRWSVNYYNDTARAVGQAARDAQSAGGGLAEYYAERDTRTPVWTCVGDTRAVAELVGLGDGSRVGGDADPDVVARWLDEGVVRFPRKRGGIDNRGRDARETEEVRPGVS